MSRDMSVFSVIVILIVEGTSLALELASVYFLFQSGFGAQAAAPPQGREVQMLKSEY